MALNPAELHALNARIGRLLDKHLAPIFKPGTQITFIARTPGNDEADVLVTTERDLNNLVALVLRSVGRAAVGHGVDTVPRINERPAPAAALASTPGVKVATVDWMCASQAEHQGDCRKWCGQERCRRVSAGVETNDGGRDA